MLVRALGAFLFVAGGAGTAYSTWAAFSRSRPADLAFAVAAPVCVVVALVGLVLVFVPGFFAG